MRRSRSPFDTPRSSTSSFEHLGTACAAAGLARAPAMALAALRRTLQRGVESEAVLAACGRRALAAGRPAAAALASARWLSGGVPVHEVREAGGGDWLATTICSNGMQSRLLRAPSRTLSRLDCGHDASGATR